MKNKPSITGKDDLFNHYGITQEHAAWSDSIDNWVSVEIFRIMHDGRLPTKEDTSSKYILDFLEHGKSVSQFWIKNVMSKSDWGSYYLTAKRMVYKYQELILKELSDGNKSTE